MAESDCFMIVFVARWGMEKPFSYSYVMLFCTLPLFLCCDEARAICTNFFTFSNITAKYMFLPLSFLPFEQVFGAEL